MGSVRNIHTSMNEGRPEEGNTSEECNSDAREHFQRDKVGGWALKRKIREAVSKAVGSDRGC